MVSAARPEIAEPGDDSARGPALLRRTLETLGPMFVKFGQFLALRPDLLPQGYRDELMALTDQAPAFSWAIASRILTEDLGVPPQEVFRTIDPQPIAAGSLAQVHVAVTHAGDEVAVKVQRDQVRQAVARDLHRMRSIVAIWDLLDRHVVVSRDDVLRELRSWLDDELDFAIELSNTQRMFGLVRDQRFMRVPRPYPALSGPRVLTTEYLRGVPFSELLGLAAANQHDRIGALGLDPDVLARRLIVSSLTQIFRHRFFHGDPHPGNLIALPGNVVGFVDFGLSARLDPTLADGLQRHLASIYTGRAEGIVRALTELLIPGPRTDLEAFRQDFLARARMWTHELERGPGAATGEPAGRSPIAQYMIDVVSAARRHDLRVPPAMLAMYRSLFSAETVASRLTARTDLRTVGRTFLARLQRERIEAGPDPDALRAWALDVLTFANEAPRQLNDVLSDLANDRFVMHVRTTATREDRRQANARARVLSAAVVQVTLAILLVGADRLPIAPVSTAQMVLAGLLGLSTLWLVFLWRRLS